MPEENNSQSPLRPYYPSFDLLRVICVALIVLIEFGLDFIPYYSVFQPFLYFSQGTLFTIYGYNVLRNGADLRKNIKRVLIAFLVMLAVYGALTLGYFWLMTGDIFIGFTKRTIFNFVVLNVWSISLGSSIWYVQSVLYSLIIFWLFRKYKKYDWLVCLILFIVGAVVGEFAGLIDFGFLGYAYIPGNFLTKTMPYMLLGRLIYTRYDQITGKLHFPPLAYLLMGIILSVAEYMALGYSGYLIYSNHLLGFILIAASLCLMCVCHPEAGTLDERYWDSLPMIYKGVYYIFNPLGYVLLFASQFICETVEVYEAIQEYFGVFIMVLLAGIFWFASFLRLKIKSFKKVQ